ncbi:serine/threonine protein kinase [Streptomyces sp. LX-29]|nr:serine/threonine protein kinase [Streptomyces sp. LX-29]
MGTVYLAHSRGGRPVAIKVARPELASQPLFRERFRAEVAAARKVGGFHTAPVVDADPDAEVPWLATAYIPGPTLSRLIANQGPMGTRQLRRLGAALAEALQAIHGCGLVHRDLKPGNIIMAEDGPRVLDFGIARTLETAGLTLTGTAFGTPGFLAPEQAEGHPVGPAADVFALGVVLVAAAGGSAFGGGTPVSLMYRSVHHPADLTAVPVPLRGTVAACLEKTPERRPTTAQLLEWFPAEDPREADHPATPTGVGAAASAAPGAAVGAGPSGAAVAANTPRAVGVALGTPGTAAAAGYAPTVAAAAVPPPPAYAPTITAVAPQPPVPPDGAPTSADPEFLAMNRKNAVLVDRDGVVFTRNGRTTEYPWHALAYLEHTTDDARKPKLTVSLLLTDDSARICTVTARNRDEARGWSAQLDAVLRQFAPEL